MIYYTVDVAAEGEPESLIIEPLKVMQELRLK